MSVYEKTARAGSQVEILDKSASERWPTDWSRDGRYIIEDVIDPKTLYDIWVLPLFGDRKAVPYLQTGFNEFHGRVSPNGHWLVYTSDETGRDEIYAQSFPNPGLKYQVSTNGGLMATWSPDGTELFFVSTDRMLMSVRVKSGETFEAEIPQTLFQTRTGPFVWFDVSKDGRFLLPTPVEPAASVPITVVINWPIELKK
jgi:Tol biopolymer transport system component